MVSITSRFRRDQPFRRTRLIHHKGKVRTRVARNCSRGAESSGSPSGKTSGWRTSTRRLGLPRREAAAGSRSIAAPRPAAPLPLHRRSPAAGVLVYPSRARAYLPVPSVGNLNGIMPRGRDAADRPLIQIKRRSIIRRSLRVEDQPVM